MKAIAVAGLVLASAALAAPADVRFEQRIGQQLPMGCVFTDETGATRTLGSVFRGKPAVLYFNYFRCPELCSLVASGTVDVLRALEPSIGRDYTVISVSFDPTDTPEMARAQQQHEVLRYGRHGAGAGWHTLVGDSASIQSLASAAGFHFAFDPRSRQYAHPSGVILVSPQGVVSSYFLGIDFPAADFASALRRASVNGLGRPVFSLLFVCFDGASPQGPYGRVIWAVLSGSVALTVAAVFGGILWMLRKERDGRVEQKEAT
jgi:protein SCO1/2